MKAKENNPLSEHTATEALKPIPAPIKLAPRPLKSILKNSTLIPFPSAPMPPPVAPSSEPQTEALACPDYFISAAIALFEYGGLEGDNLSIHDLIEAYASLSNRIRSQIKRLLANSEVPAFVPLKPRAFELGDAIVRDLKRARQEPFNAGAASWNPLDSSVQREAEQERVSRDLVELGHYVMRFVSEIFSFAPLSALFPAHDLRTFLDEILAFGTVPSIPNPSSRRICSFVVWTLSAQNLPSEALLPVPRPLVSMLQRALDGQLGNESTPLDALKAVTKLLKQSATDFLDPLSPLFSSILQHLVSEAANVRLHAVNALGRFALAKLQAPAESKCHSLFGTALADFLNSQSVRRRSSQIQSRLRSFIDAALTTHNPPHPAASPFWVVQLLASVVILLETEFFSNPAILKLTLESLRVVGSHKQHMVVGLHPHVWKCLIWAFSALPVEQDKTREAAFRILKQELRGDIPFAFVHAFLAPAPQLRADAVPKVLEVAQELLASQDRKMNAESVAIVAQLLYSPPSTAPPAFALVSPQLLGGGLLQPSKQKVIAVARSLPRCDVRQVRQLSDTEVLSNWDTLADLWRQTTKLCTDRALEGVVLHAPIQEYEDALVIHAWPTLLLAPSEMTQNDAHLTTPDAFLGSGKFSSLIHSFLDDLPVEPERQRERLQLVRKLLRGMRNTFDLERILPTAEAVLGVVLKQQFGLENEDVKGAWVQLCSELMEAGAPGGEAVFRVHVSLSEEVQRRLWNLAATQAEDMVYLLSIPIGVWTFTKDEEDTWETLLRASFTRDASLRPSVVVGRIIQQVGDWQRFRRSLPELLYLLSFYDLEDCNTLPTGVIGIVQRVLDDLYSDAGDLDVALQLIRRTQDLFASCPAPLLFPLVLSLRDTMIMWLEDDRALLKDKDGAPEIVARTFYTVPFRELAKAGIKPTVKNLHSIEPILIILSDARAFEEFWRATFHGHDELVGQYSDTLKAHLQAANDVNLASSLAQAIPPEPHSAHEDMIVFETPVDLSVQSADYHADVSRYPVADDTIGMATRIQPAWDEEEEEDAASNHSNSTVRRAPRRVSPDAAPRVDHTTDRKEIFHVPPALHHQASDPWSAQITPQRLSAPTRFESPPTSPAHLLFHPFGSGFITSIVPGGDENKSLRRRDSFASSVGSFASVPEVSISSDHAKSPKGKHKRQNDTASLAKPRKKGRTEAINAVAGPSRLPDSPPPAKRRKISKVPTPRTVAGPSRLSAVDSPSPTKRHRIGKAPASAISVARDLISESPGRRASVRLSKRAITAEPSISMSVSLSQQPARRSTRKGKEKAVKPEPTPSPRFVLECVEVPTYAEYQQTRKRKRDKEREQQKIMENSLPTPSPSLRSRPASTPVGALEEDEQEDYASWEAGISISELREVQDSLGCAYGQVEEDEDDAIAMNVEDMLSFPGHAPSNTSERRPQRSATTPRSTSASCSASHPSCTYF
ncbi:GLOBIN domain-containing protein [Mycena kentingensis (nom. inval.)]|nr:GLOBIN domain-containing protein [Mycena kentingensis (nom. inval.)]